MNHKVDKRYKINVHKSCTQNFKTMTRDYREKLLSKLDTKGNGAPEVGKYNPKHEQLKG